MSASTATHDPGLEPNLYAGTKWDTYVQYRPEYPNSLVNLILEHHRNHSNRFRLAHDVGAGNGVFAQLLAPHFDHTHVSDPDAANITDARTALGNFLTHDRAKSAIEEKGRFGTFTISITRGEAAHECTPPRSIDLITMASAAWWMDLDTAIHSVGEALAPGGTLAIFGYMGRPQIVDQPEAEAIWADVYAESVALVTEANPAILAAFANTNIGTDFIALPEEVFDVGSTKRICLNAHGQGTDRFYLAGGRNPSRARDEDQRYEFNHPAQEAQGWQFRVASDWCRGYLMSVPPNRPYIHKIEGKLSELEKLIQSTTTRKVTVEFAAMLLLATRR